MGGSPAGDNGLRSALLTVTPDALVLKIERDVPVALTPDEVVGFRIDRGGLLFSTDLLVVDHVAFDKIGNIIFCPEIGTCDQMLAELNGAGFHPAASPGVAWEPGAPFPDRPDKT